MTGMTQTMGLIVRTWSATASSAGAEVQPLLRRNAAAGVGRRPGFKGAYLLRRDLGENGTVELTAHTFWEYPEVVRAFAGDNITAVVVEPEARAMLLDFDRTATHHSVVADARD